MSSSDSSSDSSSTEQQPKAVEQAHEPEQEPEHEQKDNKNKSKSNSNDSNSDSDEELKSKKNKSNKNKSNKNKSKKDKSKKNKSKKDNKSDDDKKSSDSESEEKDVYEMSRNLRITVIGILAEMDGNNKHEVRQIRKEMDAFVKNVKISIKDLKKKGKKTRKAIKPSKVSDAFCKFFDMDIGTQLTRGQGQKLINAYAKEEGLRDTRKYTAEKSGKEMTQAFFTLDKKLKKLFPDWEHKDMNCVGKNSVNSALTKHFSKAE